MFRQTIRAVSKVNRVNAVRTYAEAASSLKLSFSMPHDTIFTNKEVTQVNVPALSGDMGILANHVPIVEQLKPGVVEILEGSNSSKFFISGGFVSVLPDSKISITSVEAFPLDAFDKSSVKTLLAEAQKNAASSDELVAAEASIEVEVLEALNTALP
ncbi:F1F0 ATP synthase subunit delta [Pichia kluyveri]|uniref:ATP synthase subunit delta, mitochondrial n=1 Tax=Pichia kluyveri TaxID=36015 RepID=A0AAV5QYT3_PICKL|nr:F1F0 ATP synthase subunit delta [Pichia kluyveri]